MPSSSGPNTVNDSVIFNYDTGDVKNSFLGRPTSNVLAGAGMSTYNNVPGSVSSNLYTTGETYRGAAVYRQDLTALDGSGASWLSGCNNPGIGVVTGGGGGTGGVYTGHSIFFKPNVPMCSTPIYLHYSNIGGWQSCCTPPEDMGDGWFRAYVLWYDTVTRSDGKYWAINPASTAVGQTVTIYWAGPFREDGVSSTNVSQYINGTRSVTQGLLDLGPTRYPASLNNVPFDSSVSPKLYFDGISDNVTVGNLGNITDFTVEIIFKSDSVANYRNPIDCNWLVYNGSYSNLGPRLEQNSSGNLGWVIGDSVGNYTGINLVTTGLSSAPYHYAAITKNATYFSGYYNGSNTANTYFNNWYGAFSNVTMGRGFSTSSERWFNGQIPIVKIYNRALGASEISNNYREYKTRFNLQ